MNSSRRTWKFGGFDSVRASLNRGTLFGNSKPASPNSLHPKEGWEPRIFDIAPKWVKLCIVKVAQQAQNWGFLWRNAISDPGVPGYGINPDGPGYPETTKIS